MLHACPNAFQVLLERNRIPMVKGERILNGSTTAETNHRS